ncbi:hypothetical protein AVEN_272555-1 [Araneus ventricosus]|uniref:Uncharacterized protein n=1 Tax=Araneus ventricosus TaxID=182803 RepID=A0A4Y2E9H2_ARAVE|nr:hypothetical protein AVEN_272555-1 [Araneus ventricosus]
MNCDEDEDDEDGNDHDTEINKPSYDEMLKSFETIRRGIQFEENTPKGFSVHCKDARRKKVVDGHKQILGLAYLVILMSRFEATRGLFWAYLVILNLGQMMRTTPELAPLLQTSAPHQRENSWPPKYDLTCNSPNIRRSFSGIVFQSWNPPAPKARP